MQQRLSTTSSWLGEQTEYLRNLRVDQLENQSSIENCKRKLKLIRSQATKNHETANDLFRMLGNLSMPIFSANNNDGAHDDIAEKFELLNFELEEKLEEIENLEEIYKFVTKLDTVRQSLFYDRV